MSGTWTCPQHHHWQPRPTDSATLDAVQPCPTCGQPGCLIDTDDDTPGDGATATAAADVRPVPASEVQVPGYEVIDEIGRGAMGVVYKARHVALNRLVALKMILAGTHAGPRDVARFRREVEVFANLRHHNIVQIYEVGEANGLPYCSLEFIEGGTLAQQLKAGPLTPHAAARLVVTLARAVHYAHERGVVHRDLKPANILLEKPQPSNPKAAAEDAAPWNMGYVALDFLPKVSDFGLAKMLDAASSLTGSSAVIGTPAYMAPEQADGQGRPITPTADVYSLGAILYECLTGRPPFKSGSALETLHQVVCDDPVPPRRLRRPVPRDLETVCLKCLEKDPDRRYPNAAALADDLERVLAGEAVRARPLGWAGRAWRGARRHRAALGGATLATAATLLLVHFWPDEPTRPTVPNRGSGLQSSGATSPVENPEILVHVTTAGNEHTAPGSLYFERGVVLSNSEQLGLTTKDGPPPDKVAVVYHPGKADERTFDAEVMSVEPAVRVAVLKLRGDHLPDPPRSPVTLAQAAPTATGPVKMRSANDPGLTTPSGRGIDVLEDARKAAVLLRVTRGGEHWVGTGFLADQPGIVVTADQVVGRHETAQPAPDKVEVVTEPGTPGQRTWPAELLAVDRDSDLAVLRIEATTAEAAQLPAPLTRALQDETVEGRRLVTLGFPADAGLLKRSVSEVRLTPGLQLRPTALAGTVLRRQGGVRLLQLEGGAESGNAGCAVVDGAGRYVGVLLTEYRGRAFSSPLPPAA